MKTQAIVLKKQNTNEYDQLITFYTQEAGKLTAIAKSILKKISIQAMHLDLFNLVNFELIYGNGYPIITGAEAENTFMRLKSSAKSLSATYVLGEYMDRLTFDYAQDDALWNFFKSKLVDLDSGVGDINNFLRSGQKELLEILGYPSLVADSHMALENIAGQKLKAISFFNQVNSMIR